jgi:molybdate transport system substrate-binding protein
MSLLLACQPSPQGEAPLTLYAASSLIDVFTELNQAFSQQHPEQRVALQTAGSQILRMQIEHGAQADLFASANRRHTQVLERLGLLEEPRLFAVNSLVLISSKTAQVAWRDLPKVERLGLGLSQVPIGAYSDALLASSSQHFGADYEASVRRRVRSREASVRLLRSRVELGGLDAAIVYASDALNRPALTAYAPPKSMQQRSELWVGRLSRSARPQAAAQWLAFLDSDAGSKILRKHGLELP